MPDDTELDLITVVWNCTVCGHHHEWLELGSLSVRYPHSLTCAQCGWVAGSDRNPALS